MSACNADHIAGPRDFKRLSIAESRWHARSFADYSYEVRSTCFCPPEMSRWTIVSVRNGRVVAAEPANHDPYLPNTTLRYWEPVDSVFAELRRQMEASAAKSLYEAVVAEFDGALGFPTSIEYRARSNVADAGGTQMLRNVRPLD